MTTTANLYRDERTGGYGDLAKRLGEKAESVEYSYTPVLAVFGSTLLMALVLDGSILRHFMGLSICVLAILKLMDISSFAESFSKYDLITQRWRDWAKVYPGVELLVGLGFLTNPPVPLSVGRAIIVIPEMIPHLRPYISTTRPMCLCRQKHKTPLGIVSFSEYAMLSIRIVIAAGL